MAKKDEHEENDSHWLGPMGKYVWVLSLALTVALVGGLLAAMSLAGYGGSVAGIAQLALFRLPTMIFAPIMLVIGAVLMAIRRVKGEDVLPHWSDGLLLIISVVGSGAGLCLWLDWLVF